MNYFHIYKFVNHRLTEANIRTLSFIFAKPNLVIPKTSP